MRFLEATAVSDALHLPIGQTGIIHSIHRDYINLQNDGDVVALVRSGCDHIPFGIEIALPGAWTELGLERQQQVEYTERAIVLNDVLEIRNLRDCSSFSCRPVFFGTYHDYEKRLHEICALCSSMGVHSGIAQYIDMQNIQAFCWNREPCVGRVPRAVQSLLQGTIDDREPLIRQGVCGLLGVGPGSTPAGDDFLMGFLSAVRYLMPGGHRHPVYELVRILKHQSPGATTFLSLAYLKYGLQDLYHQRLRELITSFGSCALDVTLDKACKLMQIGHSSGTDLLLGFVYGGTCALMAEEMQQQEGEGLVYGNL